jgi:hypothetical protein
MISLANDGAKPISGIPVFWGNATMFLNLSEMDQGLGGPFQAATSSSIGQRP